LLSSFHGRDDDASSDESKASRSKSSSSSTDRKGSEYYYNKQPLVLPSTEPEQNKFAAFACIILIFLRDGLMMIPVVLVLMLIGLDFYVLMVVEMPRRYNHEPFWCKVIIITWIPIIFLLVISYLRAVFTSSAVVDNPPPSYLNSGPYNRCAKCTALKPLRTHHCSICQKCILKMDHHCPWVGNCVGFHNYKFFCLFIFYADIGCIVFIVGIWRSLRTIFSTGHGLEASTLFAGILSAVFAFTLLFFAGFHLTLVLKNMTTLEEGGKDNYSAGSMYKNWIAVFGPQPLLWFLPVKTLEAHKGWGWNKNYAVREKLII